MRFTLISAASALLAATVKAQSLLAAIDYESTLDVYYSLPNNEVTLSVNEDGLLFDAPNTEVLCAALSRAEIVYSTDSKADVLLTSNCLSVYHLVDSSNNAITWSSCEEFSFYDSLCPSTSDSSDSSSSDSYSSASSDSSITTTYASTNTAAATFVTEGTTLVLSTATTTVDGTVTSYTTFCPVSSTVNPADVIGYSTSTFVSTANGIVSTQITEIPVTCTAGAPVRVVVEVSDIEFDDDEEASTLTTVTTTINGKATSYTTYCPLTTTEAQASQQTSIVTRTTVQNGVSTVVVETETASAAVETTVIVSTSTSVGLSTTVIGTQTYTTIVSQSSSSSTVVEAQSNSQSSESTSSAAAVSTFEGSAPRLIGSMSMISLVSIIVGLLI